VPTPCTPINRARSAYVGCVDNDTTQVPPTPPTAAPTSTPDDNQEPKTPPPSVPAPGDDNVLSETQEKMLSDLTPSSRGIGSNLRVMTRDAMIGMRKFKVRGGHAQYYCGDENDMSGGGYYTGGGGSDDFMDSCGGDDTFSSHASPGCARIGRMLSAPSQPQNPTDRTKTAPF